jgi:hypothetical protein
MANHDGVYRHFFAHAALMRDLLRDFTPFRWLDEVPIECYQRVNGSFAHGNGEQRHSDLVWRVKHDEDWLYFFVLLECQATPDKWMALRMQVYSGLLYQDLIASRQIGAAGRLPPVIPIVLYHGDQPWRARCNVADLIEPLPDLVADWTPRHRYLLIDQRRLDPARLAECRGVLGHLFRYELLDSPEVFKSELPMLLAWLQQTDYADIQPAIDVWLQNRIKPEFYKAFEEMNWTGDDMAAKFPRKFETWYDYVKQEGRQEGRQEGEANAIRRMLRGIASDRFGAVPGPLDALIDGLLPPQADQVRSVLMTAATPDEVVLRLRGGQ